VLPSGVTIAPLPVTGPNSVPGAGPASRPPSAPVILPAPPTTVSPGPITIDPAPGDPIEVAPGPVDLPLPVDKGGKPPVSTTPGPIPTPSIELCRERLGQIRVLAASAPGVDQSKATGSAMELDARDDATGSALPPALAFLVVLAGGAVLIVWLRRIPGRANPA
jgi:hypothetical protein